MYGNGGVSPATRGRSPDSSGQSLAHWADPRAQRPGEINTRNGGRGVYFLDPSGHDMEILTRPYGSG